MLTVKQKKFADEYLISGNATRAAINAGYSKNYTNTNVTKLLQNTTIKMYIEERLKELENTAIADQREVLKHLTAAMRGEVKEEVVTVEGIGNGLSSTKIIKKQLSAKDRNKAAELLGKRYGLFTDKLEANVAQTVIFEGEDSLED